MATIPSSQESQHPTQPLDDAAAGRSGRSSGALPRFAARDIWSQICTIESRRSQGDSERYHVEGLLGVGSSGEVYAVLDRSLRRPLAMKVLKEDTAREPEQVSRFVQEAQLTAGLKHPNVLPILDIDVTSDGRPCFSMSRLEGRSLSDIISASSLDARDPLIGHANAVVSIFVDVCNAIAFAHHHHVLHLDVKPDNILIGTFGEVLVIDWGVAQSCPAGESIASSYGTPLYMSPEQARGEMVNECSDQFSIGASLFHALLLRPPMWCTDPDEFLKRKRTGVLDAPTAEERRSMPIELLAIAMKAMASVPEERYPSVAALRMDLERYQAGLAISAHREGPLRSVRRWCRRHRRALVTWSVVGLVVTMLTGVICGEKLKEIATWGSPVVSEDFGAGWRGRWLVLDGGFTESNDGIITSGSDRSVLLYPRQLEGPTAIEYDAEIQPGALPCDISLVWARGTQQKPDGVLELERTTEVKIGAFDASFSGISRDAAVLAFSTFRPIPGTWYHVRVEIIGPDITASVDGRNICHYSDVFPLTGGYVGLLGWYPGKRFAHVRIYSLGVPARVEPTIAGDALFEGGHFSEAAVAYERVVRTSGGSRLGEEARYKQGLCWMRSGESERARQIWASLSDPRMRSLANLSQLDALARSGSYQQVLAGLMTLSIDATAEIRERIGVLWSTAVAELDRRQEKTLLASYLEAHDQLFPHEPSTDAAAATALLDLGRYDELLARYPDQRWQCAMAMIRQARYAEVIDRFPDLRFMHEEAAFLAGRFELMAADNPFDLLPDALIDQNRCDAVLDRFPSSKQVDRCLFHAGRFEELARRFPESRWTFEAQVLTGAVDEHTVALAARVQGEQELQLASGHFATLAAVASDDDPVRSARLVVAFSAARNGDRAALRQYLPHLETQARDPASDGSDLLVAAFAADLFDHGGSLESCCSRVLGSETLRWVGQQRLWYQAMLVAGRMDPAGFLAQPYRLQAAARLELGLAMRNERDRHPEEALHHWERWLAIPRVRRGEHADPFLEAVAQWRVAVLGDLLHRDPEGR